MPENNHRQWRLEYPRWLVVAGQLTPVCAGMDIVCSSSTPIMRHTSRHVPHASGIPAVRTCASTVVHFFVL